MKKLVLVGFSVLAVGLFILGSQSNVVGYQTQQNTRDVVLQVEVSGSPMKKAVELSEDQYQQLKLYLIDFQTRLNASRSLDETKSLFKEALGRFKTSGLLPGINTEAMYTRMCKILPKHTTPQKNISSQSYVNHLCLVYGKATYVSFQGLIADLLWFLYVSIYAQPLCKIIPFGIGNIIVSLGYHGWYGDYHPSSGYIYTNGLNGNFSCSGSFFGNLRLPHFHDFIMWECYPALAGFFGIKMSDDSSLDSWGVFMGSSVIARYVNSTSAPWG